MGVVGVLTISSGHSADYLLDAVAAGRENYYTGAVAAGEPPGRWYGAGAETLGLAGEVDPMAMRALFEHFVDPADPAFGDASQWEGASHLGHPGRKYLNAEQLYARALSQEPGADAERREQLRLEASQAERRNVAFLDATFSVQKSVTVVHTAFEAQAVKAHRAGRLDEAAAWGAHRQAVEDAIWAGNRAMLDYLAEHAGYSRVGHHGGAAGRYVDAHGFVVASFFQHDSRDHDPQLHIHNPILNRVQGPEGVWRTLDSRAVHKFRGAAGAVGERVMEEYLTAVLGVRFATRPDGKAREIVGVPARVMEMFSSRSRAITPRQAELIAEFEARHGRAPNRLQRDRLARKATFETRAAKSHSGKSREEWLTGWDNQTHAEVAGGLATVAHDVLDLAATPPAPQTWSASAVLETALAAVQEKKAGWSAPDLTREISNALPDHLGLTKDGQVGRLLDLLTEQGLKLAVPLDAARPGDAQLPPQLRRADGASVYQAPGAQLYATPAHVHTERLLTAHAVAGGAAATRREVVAEFLNQLGAAGIELGADQRAAVIGVLSSGARIESLIGPAGTGKSFVVGTLTRAWTDPQVWAPDTDTDTDTGAGVASGGVRRVFGLATSQKAADVLTSEGVRAANTTAWLGRQHRLAEGRPLAGDTEWALRSGDLVVVDESSMASTVDLAAVFARVEAAGAKMLLVGDPRQLGAVGAGGAMDMLAGAGTAYELTEARRFTHQWERAASLQLRGGDPAAALQEYHRHGRILDAGAAEQAEHSAARRYLADHFAGKQSLLIVESNEAAARINSDIRAELIRLGKVSETGVVLGHEGTFAGVGDVVQARRNGWDLAGREGNRRGPINRETFHVLETRPDGSMIVTPTSRPTTPGPADPRGAQNQGERLVLPPDYVAEHMSLGYAVTVHAAEGVTVDTAHAIVSATTAAPALYPAVTRGRESNTIHVVTQAGPAPDADTGQVAEAIRHNPRAVLGAILEAEQQFDCAALTLAADSAQTTEQMSTPAELFADALEQLSARRTIDWLDTLTDTGALTSTQRATIAAEDGAASLGRVLRRAELAGHDPHAVLSEVVGQGGLDNARGLTNVLHHRIATSHDLEPVGDTYSQWLPTAITPGWDAYIKTLAQTADARRDTLGEQVTAQRPGWALEAFGVPPADEASRAEWMAKAGVVAAHRELSSHDQPDTAIGTAPAPGQPEAYASWLAAWRALGRPEADRDEAQMSDGQLRMRVRAYEREQTWAPRLVLNELAGTIHAADTHRANALRWRTEADATTDPTGRADLESRAAQADAVAHACESQLGALREVQTARGHWLAHTAPGRVVADRAAAELAARRAGRDAVDKPVTAEEWLQAHHHAVAEDERYRVVTDADVSDRPDDIDIATQDSGRSATREQDAVAVDVREVGASDPAQPDEHTVRRPTTDATAESVRRAQRALAEITAREDTDHRRIAEHDRRHDYWRSDHTASDHGQLEADAFPGGHR